MPLGSAWPDAATDEAVSEPSVIDVAQYPRFEYSNKDVRRAGQTIAGNLPWTDESAPTIREAFQIANNWRDSHAFPMRSVRLSVIQHMRHRGIEGITAARLKRMQAIRRKLRRMNLGLNQLQDLGGCRVILPTIDDVHALVQTLKEKTRHEVRKKDDYITEPKTDGYRSHHLIFGFSGHEISIYDGRRIELQVRTRLQHSWATAVEAVGLFRGEELKNHQGSNDWLRLFVLLSGEFAEAERCSIPPGCPDQSERRREIQELARSLDAVNTLETINHGVRGTDLPLAGYRPTHYLIRYDHATKTVYVEPQIRPTVAAQSYDDAEAPDNKSGENTQNIVLVEVDKVENLKAAYPNYFGDVELFLGHLRGIMLGKEVAQYFIPPRQPAPRSPGERGDLSWLRHPRFRLPSLKKKKP